MLHGQLLAEANIAVDLLNLTVNINLDTQYSNEYIDLEPDNNAHSNVTIRLPQSS